MRGKAESLTKKWCQRYCKGKKRQAHGNTERVMGNIYRYGITAKGNSIPSETKWWACSQEWKPTRKYPKVLPCVCPFLLSMDFQRLGRSHILPHRSFLTGTMITSASRIWGDTRREVGISLKKAAQSIHSTFCGSIWHLLRPVPEA